ncbi:hypothetical protein D3C71_1907480 [compost metagenome]
MRDVGTRFENDHRVNGLAPLLAGNADHRALRHGRMAADGRLDFAAVNVFATADHHVLEAVTDVDETVIVHVTAITGVHPATA